MAAHLAQTEPPNIPRSQSLAGEQEKKGKNIDTATAEILRAFAANIMAGM